MYGHYLPLIPFAILGHNKEKAWALTMSESDDQDIYLEKIDFKKKKVLYKNKWVPLKSYTEKIKVKGEDDVNVDIYVTPHGPLLDGTKYGRKGKSLSLKWTYHHPENHVIKSFYSLGRAKNLKDFKKAVSYGAAPGVNISWVDQQGNIAWWVHGKIPRRPKGVESDIVLEGWSGKHEYLGYLSIDEHPHQINPSSGVILSTNYRPQPKKFKNIKGYWQPSERFERLTSLLSSQEKWSIEELKKVQTDQHVVFYQKQLPIMLSAIKNPKNDTQKEALNFLKKWDGSSDKDSVGSALFHTWAHYIGREALMDELESERYHLFTKISDYQHFYKRFLKSPNSSWWDDHNTDQKESREDIIKRAFEKALANLSNRIGGDVSDWKWGEIHTVEYAHPLGAVKPLNKIFNIGPFPSGGGSFQVDNMSVHRGDEKFKIKSGPSTRRLIDMKDPARSLGILPTGNSGHVRSPHFDDQAQMFLDLKYRDQLMNLEDIKAKKHSKLTLIP
jgi:penicillin amidase